MWNSYLCAHVGFYFVVVWKSAHSYSSKGRYERSIPKLWMGSGSGSMGKIIDFTDCCYICIQLTENCHRAECFPDDILIRLELERAPAPTPLTYIGAIKSMVGFGFCIATFPSNLLKQNESNLQLPISMREVFQSIRIVVIRLPLREIGCIAYIVYLCHYLRQVQILWKEHSYESMVDAFRKLSIT